MPKKPVVCPVRRLPDLVGVREVPGRAEREPVVRPEERCPRQDAVDVLQQREAALQQDVEPDDDDDQRRVVGDEQRSAADEAGSERPPRPGERERGEAEGARGDVLEVRGRERRDERPEPVGDHRRRRRSRAPAPPRAARSGTAPSRNATPAASTRATQSLRKVSGHSVTFGTPRAPPPAPRAPTSRAPCRSRSAPCTAERSTAKPVPRHGSL